MKRPGAFLLAIFVMFLSVESTVGMHLCHDVLVETSINKTLSSCCKKSTSQDQHKLSKPCCEIAHFTAELQDTIVSTSDIAFIDLVAIAPFVQFEPNSLECISKHQFVNIELPPKIHHTSLHILFEQYLI